MLSASVLIVIIVFSVVFLAVMIYLIVLSVRLKHLREKLEDNDLGIDDQVK
jgi:hypothetical protein